MSEICPAHGAHPHGGRRCLDCPVCCTSDVVSGTYVSEAEALADALPPYANALPSGVPQREPYICDDPRLCGESTSAALRRVEQERDEAKEQCVYLNRKRLDALEERDEARRQRDEFVAAADKLHDSWLSLKTELDAERDKRAEDIAAFGRACVELGAAEQERDALLSANSFLDSVASKALDDRDLARADLINTRAAFLLAEELRLKATAELVSARTELDAVRTARDNLDQLLAEARTEIQLNDAEWKLCPRCGIELNADLSGGTPALASWIVARDGGRDCVSCGQEIRRGEAYELMPGVDELRHVHCPDRTEGGTDG